MTVLVGMIIGAMLAGSGFVLGFACCMAMLAPKRDELQAAEPESEAQREEAVSRLTPTIPTRQMTGDEITDAVMDTLNKRRLLTLGVHAGTHWH